MRRVVGFLIIGVLFVGDATDAFARVYTCRNEDFEISCRNGKCERSESFTPMSISIDTKKRQLSVCAYSGCWEGRASSLTVGKEFLLASGEKLKGNSPSLGPGSGSLMIDLKQSYGSMVGIGFSNPVTCTAGK